MSTVVVAVILLVVIVAICVLLEGMAKKQKRKTMRTIHERFSRLGAKYSLNFTGQEELNDLLIGFDGIQRKLLVLKTRANTIYHSFVIDLNEIKSCSVKKQYGGIAGGELKTRKLSEYLECILLHFEFKDKPPKEICFYHHVDNHLSECWEREQKANNWKTILSKLSTASQKIA